MPLITWPGGKRKLFPEIEKHIKRIPFYNSYIEPFFGGGAVFFLLNPIGHSCILSDNNPNLIEAYEVLKQEGSYKNIIDGLLILKNTEEEYYRIRSCKPDSSLERTIRLLYLNKHCFNGLYRENRKGEFNASYGFHKSVVYDQEQIKNISKRLQEANPVILCSDWKETTKKANKNDLVFLDPPYYFTPKNKVAIYGSGSLTGLELDFFLQEFKRLTDLGAYVILTNANLPEVKEIFKDFKQQICDSAYTISCTINARQREPRELIITNF